MTKRFEFDDFEEGESEGVAFEGPFGRMFLKIMHAGSIVVAQVRDSMDGLGIGSRPISLIPRSGQSNLVVAQDKKPMNGVPTAILDDWLPEDCISVITEASIGGLDADTKANKVRHDASKARCKLPTIGLAWDSPEAQGDASKNGIERLQELRAGAAKGRRVVILDKDRGSLFYTSEDIVLGQEAMPVLGQDFGYDPVSQKWVDEEV